jgi:hypothetical protein
MMVNVPEIGRGLTQMNADMSHLSAFIRVSPRPMLGDSGRWPSSFPAYQRRHHIF